mmetsp:Transcript_32003/g.95592  ORF Transcript_32003/g.95592 Transcript_32003/m.95592 type:complete len:130 (-) Transcript_32003:760-1149(-)
MAEVRLRFRHVSGDLGPFNFAETCTVDDIKERLLKEWPSDGPMASEPPGQASDIKLILSGKFLDATKPLSEYKRDMGELGPEDVVTLHVVVRVTPASEKKTAKAGAIAASGESPAGTTGSSAGCGCVIS